MNKFTLGQQIVSNDQSTVIAGTKGQILDVYQEGGFWKYLIFWNGDKNFFNVAREKDIDAQ